MMPDWVTVILVLIAIATAIILGLTMGIYFDLRSKRKDTL